MSLASRPAVIVVFLSCAVPAFTEDRSLFESGARVRLTLPCDAGPSDSVCRVEGQVAHLDPDAITLAGAAPLARHTLASVSRIEVSRGERSRWLIGAGAGFVVGAVGTYLALDRGESTNPCDSSTNQDAIGQGSCIAIAAAGGVAGAGLGALVGSLFRSERWEDVPSDRWRVSLGPRPGARFQVSVALVF